VEATHRRGPVDVQMVPIASLNAFARDAQLLNLDDDRVLYLMANFDEVEPIIVFDDGTERTIAAGYHRTEAAERIGRVSITAEIRRAPSARSALTRASGSLHSPSASRARSSAGMVTSVLAARSPKRTRAIAGVVEELAERLEDLGRGRGGLAASGRRHKGLGSLDEERPAAGYLEQLAARLLILEDVEAHGPGA
jgi:hypothetical protein